ncbi:MAG: hypothetical protein AB8G05_21455 [Oligoflexales bacterium]
MRDDLQRWIYFNYCDKPALQQALTQFAKNYSESFKYLNVNDATTIQSRKKAMESYECAIHILDIYSEERNLDKFMDLVAVIENTLDRFFANRAIDSLSSGKTIEISKDPLQLCDFSTSDSLFLTEIDKTDIDKPGATIFHINGMMTNEITAINTIKALDYQLLKGEKKTWIQSLKTPNSNSCTKKLPLERVKKLGEKSNRLLTPCPK